MSAKLESVGLERDRLRSSIANLDHLPELDELAADSIENLQSALERFHELQAQFGK